MAASDALIVGEDWISEHYFTTDAKSESFQAKAIERRKAWDEDARNGAATVRSRFIAARSRLGTSIADLLAGQPGATDDSLPELYHELRQVLGYDGGEYILKQAGPVIGVGTPDLSENAPLVIVEARAAETIEDLIAKDGKTLLSPYEADEKTTITSVARLLSALFVADDGPGFALVLAGRWLLVAERARWAEGRYLAVDLQLVCERNETKSGGEIDRALTCVSAESLAPDAEGEIWWRGVLEDSVKHTVGVSQDLREGVRLSIEIIANEVVARHRTQGLEPLPQEKAQPLARQALRYLYRILFLLYAEASPELEVLPVGAEEYDQGYGLDRLRDLTLVELVGPRAIERHTPVRLAGPAVHARRPGARATRRSGRRTAGTRLPQPAGRPVPAQGDRADRRDRPRERRAAAGAAASAAQQGGQGQGPRLHLLRRARHQPARCGVRGADVLHRLLRRDRPVRGGEGQRRIQGILGHPRRAGRRHRREGLRPDGRRGHGRAQGGTAPAGHVRVPAGRAGTAAVGVVLHAGGADPLHGRRKRWRSCSTRTSAPRPPRRSWA